MNFTSRYLSTNSSLFDRESPIHLYDAFNGSLRCSYRAFNHVEEFVAGKAKIFHHPTSSGASECASERANEGLSAAQRAREASSAQQANE